MNATSAVTPRRFVFNHEDSRLEGRFLWALAPTARVRALRAGGSPLREWGLREAASKGPAARDVRKQVCVLASG